MRSVGRRVCASLISVLLAGCEPIEEEGADTAGSPTDEASPPDHARAGATASTTNRWYGGLGGDLNRVTYYIDPAMSDDHQAAVEAAIDAYNQLTGLDFRPGPTESADSWFPDLTDPEPHLLFADYDAVSETNPYTKLKAADPDDDPVHADLFDTYGPHMRPADNSVPRHQDYLIILKTNKDFPIVPMLDSTVLGSSTPEHEIGHVLGLFHEQNRSDAEAFITVWWCCVDPTRINAFDPNDPANELLLSPYDMTSMMQYPSENGCESAGPGLGCVCPAMTANTSSARASVPVADTDIEPACDLGPDEPRPETGFIIEDATGFSEEDLNVLYQLYPPRLGRQDPGDFDGASAAVGDFNGDGYDDVAIGSPGDRVGSLSVGGVFIYRGTYTGLVPWRRLADPGNDREDGDRFGQSLAAADVNGDGKSDLIVGAPHRRVNGVRAGAIYVYRGSIVGLGDRFRITAENAGFDPGAGGDRFGAAVATGDFDGDGSPEIAVGAPHGHFVYVVGRTLVGDHIRWRKLQRYGVSRTVADEFGAALAAGDLDGDGNDDLVIGSPGAGVLRAGRVFYVLGSASGLGTTIASVGEPESLPRNDDRFGASVAVGRYLPDAVGESLTVGAPGRQNQGRIYVFGQGIPSTATTRSLADFGDGNQSGGDFGAHLTVGQLDRFGGEDLVVGAPGTSGGGQVGVYRGFLPGDSTKLTPLGLLASPITTFDDDNFGYALAIGDFDRRTDFTGDFSVRVDDLVVSAPGRDDTAGAAWVFKGGAGELPHWPTGNEADRFTGYLVQGHPAFYRR